MTDSERQAQKGCGCFGGLFGGGAKPATAAGGKSAAAATQQIKQDASPAPRGLATIPSEAALAYSSTADAARQAATATVSASASSAVALARFPSANFSDAHSDEWGDWHDARSIASRAMSVGSRASSAWHDACSVGGSSFGRNTHQAEVLEALRDLDHHFPHTRDHHPHPHPAGAGASTGGAAARSAAAGPASPPVPAAAATAVAVASAGSAARSAPAAVAGPAPAVNADVEGLDQAALVDLVGDLWINQARPCKACQAVLAWCRAAGKEPEALGRELREGAAGDDGRQLDLAQLATTVEALQSGLDDVSSDAGWQVVLDGELKMMYRHTPGTTKHAFRARCTFTTPLEHLLALAREVDLVPTWNKYCLAATTLEPPPAAAASTSASSPAAGAAASPPAPAPAPASPDGKAPAASGSASASASAKSLRASGQAQPAPPPGPPPRLPPAPPPGRPATELLVYMVMWVPWPFNNVAFTLHASGAELLEEAGCVLVAYATPEALPPGTALPPASSKHWRVRMLRPSAMAMYPLPPTAPGGPPRTQAVMQAYVDPGIRVPPFIISFVLKVLSPFIYATVKRLLKSAYATPDTPLAKRLASRPELYSLVRQRVAAFLAGKEAAAAAAATAAAAAPAVPGAAAAPAAAAASASASAANGGAATKK